MEHGRRGNVPFTNTSIGPLPRGGSQLARGRPTARAIDRRALNPAPPRPRYDRPDYGPPPERRRGPPPPRRPRRNTYTRGWGLAAVVGLATTAVVGGATGLDRASDKHECQDNKTGLLDYLDDSLCGFGVGVDQEQQADPVPVPGGPDQVAPTTPNAPGTPTTVAAPQAPTSPAEPFAQSWYTDPASGSSILIMGGEYPAMSQFSSQWVYPEGEHGGRCGDLTYANGLSRLLGRFVSPVEVWTTLDAAGGHGPGGSGSPSDRALVAQLYGLQPHDFHNSIQEAEDFARNVDPNVFVIAAQYPNSNEDAGFSVDAKHIFGLWWNSEHQAWQAVDPNDYDRPSGVGQETEMEDLTRFWTSDQITNLYHVAGITNPSGIPPSPWEQSI